MSKVKFCLLGVVSNVIMKKFTEGQKLMTTRLKKKMKILKLIMMICMIAKRRRRRKKRNSSQRLKGEEKEDTFRLMKGGNVKSAHWLFHKDINLR